MFSCYIIINFWISWRAHRFCRLDESLELVKVQVAICVISPFGDFTGILHVLLLRWDAADHGSDGGDLGRGEVDVRVTTETMGEITCFRSISRDGYQ